MLYDLFSRTRCTRVKRSELWYQIDLSIRPAVDNRFLEQPIHVSVALCLYRNQGRAPYHPREIVFLRAKAEDKPQFITLVLLPPARARALLVRE